MVNNNSGYANVNYSKAANNNFFNSNLQNYDLMSRQGVVSQSGVDATMSQKVNSQQPSPLYNQDMMQFPNIPHNLNSMNQNNSQNSVVNSGQMLYNVTNGS